jgi:transposase
MITTIGIDLAKNVFQLHGVDVRGHTVLKKQLRRAQMTRFFATLSPCLIGMEACASAHHWARTLQSFGHTVKLMAPQFVNPYVKSQKNDAADAEAICEAVSRLSMRFVAIKSIEQQGVLALHRVRQSLVSARIAQANQIRSLLAEMGLILPLRIYQLRRVPELLEQAALALPQTFCRLILDQLEYFKALQRRIAELDHEIRSWHRECPASRRLAEVPGIGPLNGECARGLVGDGRNFANGRQLAAWIGLVPRQHSSGGKPVLLGVGKRGDGYLRTLLVHVHI